MAVIIYISCKGDQFMGQCEQ